MSVSIILTAFPISPAWPPPPSPPPPPRWSASACRRPSRAPFRTSWSRLGGTSGRQPIATVGHFNSETVVLKERPPSNLNISQERDDGSGAAVLWPGTLQRQREPRPGARLRQPRGERTGNRRIIEQCFAGSQQNCQVFAQVIQFRNSSSWRRSLQGAAINTYYLTIIVVTICSEHNYRVPGRVRRAHSQG